jgi:hypothetical protein
MHTLLLILADETEYRGPAFKLDMNVVLMEQFCIVEYALWL